MRDLHRLARWLGVAAAAGMFLVLVMGATVTNTGSEHGCGKSWPLCNGKFVPQFTVSTFIEFSHRAVVGVESCLIIALAVLALYLYPRRREIQVLSGLMVGFLFLQAALGAWAVMYPQVAVILALHFGVSLIAFASVLLTAIYLFEATGADRVRDLPIMPQLRWAVVGVTIYSYAVIYLGAYVRHIDADEACRGWPRCNGALVPDFHGKVAAAFAHRVAAGLLILAIAGLVVWTARNRDDRPDLFGASVLALALVCLQAVSGAFVVFTNLDLFSALAHAALVGLMFGCLAYLCLHVLRRPLAREERVSSAVRAVSRTDPAGIHQ